MNNWLLTAGIICYVYSALITLRVSYDELERLKLWQRIAVSIFWPLAPLGLIAFFLYVLVTGLPVIGRRWIRRYKWLHSEEYKRSMAKFNDFHKPQNNTQST